MYNIGTAGALIRFDAITWTHPDRHIVRYRELRLFCLRLWLMDTRSHELGSVHGIRPPPYLSKKPALLPREVPNGNLLD